MVNDQIADLLTRIRNGQRAGHRTVLVTQTRMADRILTLLEKEGFISGFSIAENTPQMKKDYQGASFYAVKLKYFESGQPVISVAKRVSRSGRRMYAQATKMPKILSGLGLAIVSTSQGVMSDSEARQKKIGGEVLAFIG